jgi:hypothetical protein
MKDDEELRPEPVEAPGSSGLRMKGLMKCGLGMKGHLRKSRTLPCPELRGDSLARGTKPHSALAKQQSIHSKEYQP